MILHPAILALFASSAVVSLMLVYASGWAVVILRRWDLRSGSELQLALERRTYLISTAVGCVLCFQLASLFLYIFTADRLSLFFVGAMCAAGTLNAQACGYPTLGLKVANFVLAGGWLLLNYADTRGWDYPLLRAKCWVLLVLTPLVLLESVLQARFFLGLDPKLITSCCGSLFSAGAQGLAGEMTALPLSTARVAFFACVAATLALGARPLRTAAACYLYSASSLVTFAAGVAALVSFVSLYVYELPTHHCPFCVLQAGYHYVGYPLYLALLSGAVFGLGVGALTPFRGVPSVAALLGVLQRRFALLASSAYGFFAAVAAYRMVFTSFRP